MSSLRRGSSRPLRPQEKNPPKKSRTGLIIIIVVIIVVLLVVGIIIAIILWRRSQSSSGGPTVTKCSTTTDCPSGKVCNTTSGVCVTCLANTDCSGATPICSNSNCVACVANTDCTTDPLKPVCTANACVDCAADTDCTGNVGHVGEDFCVNKNCVECKVDADCTGIATCVSNACCDTNPPTITTTTATLAVVDTINTTFTFVQTPADVKYKLLVGGKLSGMTASVTGTTMTVTLFDATQFNLAIGQYVWGPAFPQAGKITALGTGTGGTGTYTLDISMTAASGPADAYWLLYSTPTPLTPTASPQLVTINDTQFGRRLEPGTEYFSIIEASITCGSSVTVRRSNAKAASTAGFAAGDTWPPTGFTAASGYPNITGSTPNYVLHALCLNGGTPSVTGGIYVSATKWTNLAPSLFGIVPGSSPIVAGGFANPALYQVTLEIPFTLALTSGTLINGYYKIWGGDGQFTGGGTCFWDWRYVTTASTP